jgi:hypothetical protein
LIFQGGRRGGTWRIATVPERGEADEPAARALYARIAAVCNGDPHLVAFSGARPHALVLTLRSEPMRHFDIDAIAGASEWNVQGRLQGQSLFQIVDEMVKDAVMLCGTIEMRDPAAAGAGGVVALTWRETVGQLANITHSDLRQLTADAKHAKRYGNPTPLQLAILLFKEELNAHCHDVTIANNLCTKIGDVLARYPTDFSPNLPNLRGWEFDHVTQSFRDVTFAQYYSRLYMDKACCLIGSNGAGKSALCAAIAKDFAIRKRKETFVVSKALDPLGNMTRSGAIQQVGAFVLNDCPLRTLMNEILDNEAVKSLMDVRETCSFPARYHVATLPARHARLFSANSAIHADGSVDHGFYFASYRQTALAMMARRDLTGLLRMDDDQRAICHRVIMFTPSGDDIGLNVAPIRDAADVAYDDELEIQRAFYGN